jgi:Esterase FrsA-like
MATDPRVDLVFSHNMPRYEATGIDPNDLRALMKRIDRWEDWCRVWSDEGARHEAMAREAAEKEQAVTAAAAFIRASIYYHYGKHLFADHPEEFRAAHESMLRCYSAGATGMDPPLERVEFPYKGASMPGWLHKPSGNAKPPVAVILPGLDAC